jgi:hypothetical protein
MHPSKVTLAVVEQAAKVGREVGTASGPRGSDLEASHQGDNQQVPRVQVPTTRFCSDMHEI